MPRLSRRPLPRTGPDLADALGKSVEDDGIVITFVTKSGAGDGQDGTVGRPVEDSIGIKDGDLEVTLELLQQAEHSVDRAAGRFGLSVDADDQEAAVQKIASRDDGSSVRGPLIEKGIHGAEKARALRWVEHRRDPEDPDPRVVRELRNVDAGHVDYTPEVSFAKLLQRFKNGVQEPEPQKDPLRLATAAVLLEIAYADGQFTPAEDGDVVGYLKQAFDLSDEEAAELVAEAAELRNRTIDHFSLTNYIRKNAALNQRVDIVKTMWRIVYADRKLTDYENYLVRKLADLLGLEHHVMIQAKVSVLRELGMNP